MEELKQDPEKIKIEVNTLLWMHLPAETKIGDAEIIAMKIWRMILNPQEYLNKK